MNRGSRRTSRASRASIDSAGGTDDDDETRQPEKLAKPANHAVTRQSARTSAPTRRQLVRVRWRTDRVAIARTRRRRNQRGGRRYVPGRSERDGEVDNVSGTVD